MLQATSHDLVQSYHRGQRNLAHEHGQEPLVVDGRLPADLRGTLYYNGPALFSLYDRPYRHWFDGDGAMTAIRFDQGHASGAVRLVQSRGLAAERAAGRPLFSTGATLAPTWRQRLGMRFKNVANTKPMWWNDRLFALYEAGLPTELDPETLATLDETDLDGAIRTNFCAHFHAVPARGKQYNFSLQRGRRNVLHVVEMGLAGGGVRPLVSVPLPVGSASMLHDFIATENHLVFFVSPVGIRIGPALLGLKAPFELLRWRPELGTTVLVIPLDDPTRYRQFETEAFFQYHFLNAHEEGDAIHVDFVHVSDFGAAVGQHTVDQRQASYPTKGRLTRATVRPGSDQLTLRTLWDQPCEFPQVAPGVVTRAQRFAYVLASREGEPQTLLAKHDFHTGQTECVQVGPHQFPSEAVFVPRAAAAVEDDGYLITQVYDASVDRSAAVVYDARDLGKGPLARAWFSHHIPRPLHGTWRGV